MVVDFKKNSGASAKFLLVISSCGGGDWPPLMSLAAGLSERGHDVIAICDEGNLVVIREAGIEAICLPPHLHLARFINPALEHYFRTGENLTPESPNPIVDWAQQSIRFVLRAMGNDFPSLILSSLFCQELSVALSEVIGVPWCFVNPGYSFIDMNSDSGMKDFSPLGLQMYAHWLMPPAKKATMVLHATDFVFDASPQAIPDHHHYVGSLFWEMGGKCPSFLHTPGPPWVLVSLSTVPQTGDLKIVRATIDGLATMNVRVLVTLAPEHDSSLLGPVPDNVFITGYIPHSEVLPLCRLAISHAGHGMVLKSMYYGTPMVLVPWGRDQPGVARRAEAMGGAIVVHKNDCSAGNIENAAQRVMADTAIIDRCASNSLRLKTGNPDADACGLLESLL